MCHIFIRRSGEIRCEVTGPRRYSSDLPQGGLEIPCTLTFTGKEKDVSKVKKLLSRAPPMVSTGVDPVDVPPKKKIKQEEEPSVSDSTSEKIWLRAFGCYLTVSDKYILQNKEQLNDRHIDFAERILLPLVFVVWVVLCSKRRHQQKNGIQIIHDRGNHWIVAIGLLQVL